MALHLMKHGLEKLYHTLQHYRMQEIEVGTLGIAIVSVFLIFSWYLQVLLRKRVLTNGQSKRNTNEQPNRNADGQSNRNIDGQSNRNTFGQSNRNTDGQSNRNTFGQSNRNTFEQSNRNTFGQLNRYTVGPSNRNINGHTGRIHHLPIRSPFFLLRNGTLRTKSVLAMNKAFCFAPYRNNEIESCDIETNGRKRIRIVPPENERKDLSASAYHY